MMLSTTFASALGVALVHSLWQLSLLGLLAALCLAALRQSSAAFRHSVGLCWLLAMVAVPAGTLVRCWQLAPVQGSQALLATRAQPMLGERFDIAAAPWFPALPDRISELWLLGVALMAILHLGGGWHLLRRLERAPCHALPDEWRHRVDLMSKALGIRRKVAVRLAATVGSPFTARLLRPVIWLPRALLSSLPVDQVKAILAHELAHIHRLDWLWNGIQCVVESLLFFHPAMWLLSRQVRQEREHACDDLAVAVCGDSIALAEGLAALARERWTTPSLVLAARGGALSRRISRILSPPQVRATPRGPALAALLLSAGMWGAMQANSPLHTPGELTAGSQAPPSGGQAGAETRPAPPPPSLSPSLYESPEFRALFISIQSDPGLKRMLGAFPAVEPDSLKGDIRMWKESDAGRADRPHRPSGTADFTLALSGDAGRAQVRYAGKLTEGEWKTSRMEVTRLATE